MSFGINRRDTELRSVTKFGENRPLRSSRKVAWFRVTKQKKLGLRGTRPSPHFGQNGPIAPKIPWTLSPLDLSTYTEFGPDRLRFAGLIPERLAQKVNAIGNAIGNKVNRLSAYNKKYYRVARKVRPLLLSLKRQSQFAWFLLTKISKTALLIYLLCLFIFSISAKNHTN